MFGPISLTFSLDSRGGFWLCGWLGGWLCVCLCGRLRLRLGWFVVRQGCRIKHVYSLPAAGLQLLLGVVLVQQFHAHFLEDPDRRAIVLVRSGQNAPSSILISLRTHLAVRISIGLANFIAISAGRCRKRGTEVRSR